MYIHAVGMSEPIVLSPKIFSCHVQVLQVLSEKDFPFVRREHMLEGVSQGRCCKEDL